MTIFGASIGLNMCFFRQTLLSVCLVVPIAVFGQLVANDDAANTSEDVNVSFNVATNDSDPTFGVDPATVDLDPSSTSTIENSISTPEGDFSVDAAGLVTFSPAQDFSGQATTPYTIRNLNTTPETSNEATITVTVDAVNDLPTITVIGDQTIDEDAQTSILDFTIGDVETDPATLTVSGASDNQLLVPDANIIFGGSGANRNVQVTPLPDASGMANITITVDDGTDNDAVVFVLTVTAINDLPTITAISDQTIDQDESTAVLPFTITDIETAAASLTVLGASDNTTLVPNLNIDLQGSGENRTVQVTPEPGQFGTATITITVDDGDDDVQETFQLTVNSTANTPPTISSITDQTIDEDNSTGDILFTVGDAETPVGSMIVTGSSDNVSLIPNANIVLGGSGADRTVNVTPLADQSGTAMITLTVDDGTVTAQTTFQITVNGINDLPTISSIANQTIDEDNSTGALAFTVMDIETPAASLAVTGSSDNTSLIPNGNIVFGGSGVNRTVDVTPASNQAGVATITLVVNDGTATVQTTFQVTVNAANDLPTISAIANQIINEDNSTGALAFTVGDVETAVTSLVVTGSSNNTALIPNANIVLAGTDANRTVNVTPLGNHNGVATITLTVNDGAATAQTTFQVTVNAINDSPTITSISNQAISEDQQTGNLAFTISDVETPAGSLTVTRSSSNTVLVPLGNVTLGGSGANRTVNVVPVANLSGSTTITLTVSDGVNNTQTMFQVLVTAVNDLPTITSVSNQTIDENTSTGALPFSVGDIETAPGSLSMSGSSGNPVLVPNGNIVFGGTGANRTVTVTPAANQSGVAIITMTVSDGSGTAQSFFQVTVNAVDDPPTITSIANQTINEDTQTGQLSFTVNDNETPATALTLTKASSNLGLVPNANVVLGGMGSLRNVNVIPLLNQNGVTTITLTVSDGLQTAQTAFMVTVSALDDPPTITPIADQVINEDQQTAVLDFTVGDPDTDPATLILNATSDNTTLVPNLNVVLGGAGTDRTVQVTPVADLFGEANITITVSDGVDTEQITFKVTVNSVNDSPTITAVADQTIDEDSPGTGALAFTIGDVETPPGSLVVTRTSSNTTVVPLANVVLGGSGVNRTVAVTPAPNQSGTTTITLIVDDGTTTTQTQFDVTVNELNDPPQITAIANETIAEDGATGALPFTVADIETPVGSLTLSGASSNPTLVPVSNIVFGGSGANRTVTVTPAADQFGTSTITVTVSDGSGTDDSNFLLTVTSSNDTPTITAIADQTIDEDQVGGTGALSFTVDDVETAPASLTVTRATSNPTLVPLASIVLGGGGASRTVTVTPAANQSGTATITLTVSDGSANAQEVFIVNVTSVNDDPTITAIADQVIDESTSTGPLSFTVGDVETPPASLTVTRASSNTTLVPLANVVLGGSGASRNVNVTPVPGESGVATITITVNDGEATAISEFDVTVNSVDDPPTVTAIADQVVAEDNATGALSFTIGDPDTPIGSLTLSGSSSNTTLVPNSNIVFGGSGASRNVTVTPEADQNGTTTITVNVSDGTNTTPETFLLTVNATNDGPTISAIADQTVNEDTPTGDIVFTIGDAETPATSLIVTASSSNTTLVPNANITLGGTGPSRTIDIAPASNQSGVTTITVNVSDGSITTPRTFLVTVSPTNDPPTITAIADQSITEDTPTGALAFTIGDVETPVGSLTITQGSSNTVLVPIANVVIGGSGASRTVTVTPAGNQTGTTTITLTVDDGTATTSINFIVNVTPVDDPPTISAITNRTINEDSQTGTIPFTVGDPETAAGSLTVTGSSSNTTLVPNANIVLGGTGATRNVNIIPAADQNGTVDITLNVSDGLNSTPTTFQVTVTPVNDQPIITNQIPVTINEGEAVTLTVSMLTILDPDNVFPTDFSLLVSGGTGYSIEGATTIRPNTNVNGVLSVPILVGDGATFSPVYQFQITVNSTNDAPQITGQQQITIPEDQAYNVPFSDLVVNDPDNLNYPTGFTLELLPGTNYAVNDNDTFTPVLNFNGSLSVNVRVNDGQANSNTFPLVVTVTPVNDAPVITNQATLTMNEDTQRTLVVGNFTISDPEPASHTLIVQPSTSPDYTVSGNEITPSPNFYGTLSVPVTVSDGTLTSVVYNAQITVNPVNDAPQILNQTGSLSTVEDTPIILNLNDLTVNDIDNNYPTGFTLIVEAGTNYTFTGTTVTPTTDFVGDINVVVRVNDGVANSPQFLVLIQVTDDADAPVINGQNTVALDEDTSREIVLGDLVWADPDTQESQITVAVQPGTNYTLEGNFVVPTPNFYGTLTVPVRINDGEANSNLFQLQVTVNSIPDAPTFNQPANMSIQEDAAQLSFTITGISPGPLESQPLQVTAISDNTALILQPVQSPNYNGTAPTVTYVFKPEPNMYGVATITVRLVDSDFLEYIRTFTITVNSVNDAPTLSPIANTTVIEDAIDQIIDLTGISPGGGPLESTQTLSTVVSVTNASLFDEVPTAEIVGSGPGGSLRFKLKPNANGTTQITVRLQDSGQSASPNVNFINRTFTLTVTPSNDLPEFTTTPGLTAEPGLVYTYNVEVTDVDGEAIALTAPTKPAWLNFVNGTNGKATLSGTPPLGTSGDVEVILQAKDPTGNPVQQPFTITVNSRPVLEPVELTIEEDLPYPFQTSDFTDAFTDADGNPLAELEITGLPGSGTLVFNGNPVAVGTKILLADIPKLIYTPATNSNNTVTFRWNASDGFGLSSQADTSVTIIVEPKNDAPIVTIVEVHDAPVTNDTLKYELGSEVPVLLTPLFEASEPDGDNILSAVIQIENSKYRSENEVLTFVGTPNINGVFTESSGVLTLTGSAPVAEYVDVIRSVQYNYLNTRELILDSRRVSITLDDGKVGGLSVPDSRVVELIYTFSDLDIPTAFTPNGDTANETWNITSANGTAQYDDAEVRVYNKRGLLLFETKGFETQWNGVWNGEMLPSDTYFYTIELNYNKVRYKGTVTILR